jgi:hypothetical protein
MGLRDAAAMGMHGAESCLVNSMAQGLGAAAEPKGNNQILASRRSEYQRWFLIRNSYSS